MSSMNKNCWTAPIFVRLWDCVKCEVWDYGSCHICSYCVDGCCSKGYGVESCGVRLLC